MTIDLSKEDHKRLKAIAALLDKSMREIVLESIEKYIQNTNTPENVKAIAHEFDPLAKD